MQLSDLLISGAQVWLALPLIRMIATSETRVPMLSALGTVVGLVAMAAGLAMAEQWFSVSTTLIHCFLWSSIGIYRRA